MHTVPFRHLYTSYCTVIGIYVHASYRTVISIYTHHTVLSVPTPQQRHAASVTNTSSITVQAATSHDHSSTLSSLRKVFITESGRNKLSSPHHALNSLLFAPDGYPTATEDPAGIKETERSGTIGGRDTGSGWECRDWVPFMGGPHFPLGRIIFSIVRLFIWSFLMCTYYAHTYDLRVHNVVSNEALYHKTPKHKLLPLLASYEAL